MITRCTILLALTASLAFGAEPKAEKLDYTVHSGHFEKNTSGLKGEDSFLLLGTREQFDEIFGAGFVMGKKPAVVPKEAFEKKLVAAVIHRGNAMWTYEVTKVTSDGGTVTIEYKAKPGEAGTARFASPLILSFDKGKAKKVVFVENGKKAGEAELKK
jgi:hypothetical protein